MVHHKHQAEQNSVHNITEVTPRPRFHENECEVFKRGFFHVKHKHLFLFHTSEQGIINLAAANNNINVKTRIKSG